MENRILLIDGNSLLFRSFYATARKDEDGWRSPMRNDKDEATNAVRVFASVTNKIIGRFSPTHILVAFDSPVKTFRHDYEFYKSTRKTTPSDLSSQFKKTKEMLDAMSIKWTEIEGLEADDIIGTGTRKFAGLKLVFTGDKDMFQLINKETAVYFPDAATKDYKNYNTTEFKKAYEGLEPIQLIDLKALMGDTSDNIPGVSGIGKKTAMKLISEFGSIENLYEKIESGEVDIKGNPLTKLTAGKEKAFMSKEIVKIINDGNIDVELNDIEYRGFNDTVLKEYLESEQLYSLLKLFEL